MSLWSTGRVPEASPVPMVLGRRAAGDRIIAGACFALCALAVGYGIYTLVPAFY